MPIDIALRNDASVINNDRGNYWRYYGLQCDPFAPGAVHNEIFASSRWEEYTDLLHYLCNSSNALLLVLGIKGVGKTTFMRQFMSQLDQSTRVCQLHGTTALEVEQITAAMERKFAIQTPYGETLEEYTESLVMNIQQSAQPCLLIIDDAHRLSEEVSQMLLCLIRQQSEAQMRLHIVLLGTPQLNETYARLSAAEREQELIHGLNLEPLTFEETHRYIKHRLAVAGLPAAIPLSQATIKRIYNLSEGVIGRINVVARQAMIDGMRKPHLHIALDLMRAYKTAFIGGSIFLAALISVALFLARGSHLPHFSIHFTLPNFQQFQTSHKPDEPVAVKKAVATPTSVPVAQKAEVQEATIPNATQNLAKTGSQLTIISADKAGMGGQASAFMQPPMDFMPSNRISEDAPSISNNVNVENPTVMENNANEVVEDVDKSQSIVVAQKKIAIIKKPSQKPMTARWLLEADPQHFTVQLIGLSKKQAMQKFITDNHLQGKVTYFHTLRNGKDWYVLVSGEYATIPQAQAAIKNLPLALQAQKPWVRKLSNVKEILKQNINK